MILDIKESLFALPFYQDSMLQTQVYWLVIKTVSQAIKQQQPLFFGQKMLADLLHLPNTNDLTLSLAFLTIAAKLRVDWGAYLAFNLWANISSIVEPAELERLVIPIAKTMLEERKEYEFSYIFYVFYDWIESISLRYPESVYVRYYAVQLLIHTGDLEQAQLLVKDLVKAKKNDFWVWQLMAVCYQDKAVINHSALCKALALGGKERMLVGLRQEFAEKLITEDNWKAAKYEIEKIVGTRTKESWKIPSKVQEWMSKSEYKNVTGLATNYIAYTHTAEELLWETAPPILIVVIKIDLHTQMAYYMTENDGGGKISLLKTQAPGIEIGKTYKAYTRKHPTKDYNQVMRLSDTDEKVAWFKKFTGVIRINTSGIGFVDNAYIAANLVAASKLNTDMLTNGYAIKSYDHKKNQEGWKVISINKVELSTE
ncbi:tetratricopeptide repeat protein [Emticicia sp. W12TSBA100-4]|uniref:tetratricopeptide repeat protein n=1 Tax=Emticicia sp. W12TSBA100-4 TaxID=3160965 RepID=UPI003305669E